MGINGIALSTTIITLINAILLALLIRKKISIGYRAFIVQIFKIIIAAIAAFLIGNGVNIILGNIFISTFILKIVKVSIVFIISL